MDTKHNGSFKILYLKQNIESSGEFKGDYLGDYLQLDLRKLILVKHLHVHGNPGSRNPKGTSLQSGKKNKHTMIITNHQTLIEHPYSDATEIF